MTKVYELPNGHRMVAGFDESTMFCTDGRIVYTITETQLDSLIRDLYHYAEQANVLDNLKTEIRGLYSEYGDGFGWEESRNITLNEVMKIIDKYRNEVNK